MAKEYKKLTEWLDSLGYNANVWIGGDWHQPMHLLSKLLVDQLSERRPLDLEGAVDVSFKISFDSMTELADETLGVPALVTEKDLMINFPNIFLAQLVQLIALKHTLEKVDIAKKQLQQITAPKLVFEARNGMDAQFPRCPSCHEHVFFLERVLVEKTVWHRQCLKCVVCGEKLKAGTFKKSRTGNECIIHSIRKILDEKEQKKSPRPCVPPPPVPVLPLPSTPISEDSTKADIYEAIDIDAMPTNSELTIFSERDNATQGEATKERKPKPAPPPKPKHLCSSKPVQETEVDHPCNSSDSGVSISSHHYDTVEDKNLPKIREENSAQTSFEALNAPIAPPRPKRASMLLTAGITSISSENRSSIRSPSPTPYPQPAPRSSFKENTPTKSSNPFDEEDELKVNFDYDESKNPFADSSDDEYMPTPAPRTTIPASLLPGESDRPKALPPPPPTNSTTPTRALNEDEMTSQKLQTLRISRKKRRAPLPPNLRRIIAFTENQQLEEAARYEEKVKKLDEDVSKFEREGKKIEMELLLKISTNPKDWYKLPRTDDYISTAQKLLDILAEQTRLLYSWKEAFLNEIHSETDFLLRNLVEKDLKDDYSAQREKQLLRLLVDIMDEKAKLTESHLDGSDSRSRESSCTRKEKKKTKMLRMAILSKKLRNKKKN